jgi:hypothetical protein
VRFIPAAAEHSPVQSLYLSRPIDVLGRQRSASATYGSSIHVLAMTDPSHDDEQLPVPDRVDDSIPTHSDTIPIVLSGKLLATRRPRIIGQ